MEPNQLTESEVQKIRRMHKQIKDRRIADRFKAVLMRNKGKSWGEIADTLLLEETTVKRYISMYEEGGGEQLLIWECKGNNGKLTNEQKAELATHLDEHCYQKAEDIIGYLKEGYGADYTLDGVTKLIKNLGFVYKQFSTVPSGADPIKQETFIQEYEELKAEKQANEVILFADAVHPNLEAQVGRGWIRSGVKKSILAPSGRERLNILGAINLEEKTNPLIANYETINSESVVDFINKLEEKYPDKKITLICDNARYFHGKMVRKRLENSRVKFKYLPAYAPNLNPIERFWKFFKQYGIKNRYFSNLKRFKDSCFEFFDNLEAHSSKLDSWITDKFKIIDPFECVSLG